MGNGFIVRLFEQPSVPLGEQRFAALPIRIGRSSLNDFQVSHKLVSEFHARIEEVDGKICVRDLSSKNGVFVRVPGKEQPVALAAQAPRELESHGFEFLLSPALRVQLSPAPSEEGAARRSRALGSVLGNARLLNIAADAVAGEDAFTASMLQLRSSASLEPPSAPPSGRIASATPPSAPVPSAPVSAPASVRQVSAPASVRQVAPPEPAPASIRPLPSVSIAGAGSVVSRPPTPPSPVVAPASAAPLRTAVPTPLPALPAVEVPPLLSLPALPKLPALSMRAVHASGTRETRAAESSGGARAALPAPRAPVTLASTAWDAAVPELSAGIPGDARHEQVPSPLPAAAARDPLEVLALRGLRELADSLAPGVPLETSADLASLITRLHDSLESFCRCFIPVREGAARFVAPADLEQAARERTRHRSGAFLAVERARTPRELAAALLDGRHRTQDGPAAIESIFADLVSHQLALQQGALAGVQSLLSALAPERIEAGCEAAGGRGALALFSGRHRELWEAYASEHAQLEQAREAFFELFGPEFARAYQRYWRRGAAFEHTE